MTSLEPLRNDLLFEQITIAVVDDGHHWQFSYGNTPIADYWPSTGRGQVLGTPFMTPCTSPVQAKRLAIRAKKRLFGEMSQAMHGEAQEEDEDV